MTKEKAVQQLMSEWKADEKYKPFFVRVVDNYMGIAKDVLSSDIDALRKILNDMR